MAVSESVTAWIYAIERTGHKAVAVEVSHGALLEEDVCLVEKKDCVFVSDHT